MEYYNICDTLRSIMTATALRQGRLRKGLSQTQAAHRLGVSQPYLAMLESGRRRLTPELSWKAARVYGLSPALLPHSPLPSRAQLSDPGALVSDLASLGYPGFSYLRPRRPRKPKNPGDVLLTALAQPDLEARLVEALPWLLLKYPDVDREWLVREAKVRDLQNRLGFVVSLARRLAEKADDQARAETLRSLEAELDRSRLDREDMFDASVPEPERRWLEQRRPEDAKRWKLLTDWTADGLRYTAV
jgi:transcriptional regulator with XRE-family HTH domain